MPSIPQLIIILIVVALIFGTKRLKGIGGDLGGAIKGFKKALGDDSKDKEDEEVIANSEKVEDKDKS